MGLILSGWFLKYILNKSYICTGHKGKQSIFRQKRNFPCVSNNTNRSSMDNDWRFMTVDERKWKFLLRQLRLDLRKKSLKFWTSDRNIFKPCWAKFLDRLTKQAVFLKNVFVQSCSGGHKIDTVRHWDLRPIWKLALNFYRQLDDVTIYVLGDFLNLDFISLSRSFNYLLKFHSDLVL